MAIPKGFLLYPLVIYPVIRLRNIRKVNVVVYSILILPKHEINRRTKLDRIFLINIVYIDPEVF
jgi:hypothetical protein